MGPWRKTGRVALFLPLLMALAASVVVSGQSTDSCSSYSFSDNRPKFATCVTLSELSSFLHWTYNASAGTADIAFRATQISTATNWVAWALNPTGTIGAAMPGAQALVAYKHMNGSTWAYTSAVKDVGTTLAESDVSFTVTDLSTESIGDTQIIIFAKVHLPNNSTTSLIHLWQAGPLSSSGSPSQHDQTSAHLNSKGTLNFLSGIALSSSGATSRERKRSVSTKYPTTTNHHLDSDFSVSSPP